MGAIMGGVYPADLPANLYAGLLCYFGIDTVTEMPLSNSTLRMDDCNPAGPMGVNIYLVFNISYNILIIFILKYGSANILWLAMTVMVPLGNLAFALPFMPGATGVTVFDIAGLVVIMAGLIGYRQGPVACKNTCPMGDEEGEESLLEATSA